MNRQKSVSSMFRRIYLRKPNSAHFAQVIFLILIFIFLNIAEAKSLLQCIELFDTSDTYTSDTHTEFIQRAGNTEFESLVKNAEFISLSLGFESFFKKSGYWFLNVENSMLKYLNDTIQDKVFVDALNNRFKTLLYRALVAKLSDPNIIIYNDYKSIQIAFTSHQLEQLTMSELNQILIQTTTDFTNEVHSKRLVPQSFEVHSWFRAGFGRNADESNLAARFSRWANLPTTVIEFNNRIVQEHFNSHLQRIQFLSNQLLNDPSLLPLMSKVKINDDEKLFFSSTLFEVLRKVNDKHLETIKYQLIQMFPLLAQALTEKHLAEIQEYYQKLNLFSVGMLIQDRPVLNLHEAEYGGLSADFIGLGAANIQATGLALKSAQSLEEAVKATRIAEQRVTDEFNRIKDEFRRLTSTNLRCSGDDCIYLFLNPISEDQKLRLIKMIAESPILQGRIRIAFIPPEVPIKLSRTLLAVHGESIEKLLRESLIGKIQLPILKSLVFAIDMKTQTLGEGNISLIVGSPQTLTLTNAQRKKIKNAFQEAVFTFNSVLKNEGSYLADYISFAE